MHVVVCRWSYGGSVGSPGQGAALVCFTRQAPSLRILRALPGRGELRGYRQRGIAPIGESSDKSTSQVTGSPWLPRKL